MFFINAWNFIKKNLFYICLILCVAAIGVVTVIVSLPKEEKKPAEAADKQQTESLSDVEQSSAAPDESKTAASPEPTPEATHKATSSGSSKPVKLKLTLPLKGQITEHFSGEVLVFNKTLNMWMTHNGIDISAEENTEVCAALSGTVDKVESDDTKGKTVHITHTDGSVTVYSGLSDCEVEAGSKVNSGQQIGSAGTPAFESAEGPHLHFEYIVSGEYVDPEKFIG